MKRTTKPSHSEWDSEKDGILYKKIEELNQYIVSISLKRLINSKEKEILLSKKFSTTMKIFQIIQQNYAVMGVISPPPNCNHPFNFMNLLTLFSFIQLGFGTWSFLLFKAETFSDYTEALFVCTAVILGILTFENIVIKAVKFVDLIRNLESSIEKRELLKMKWRSGEQSIMKIIFSGLVNKRSKELFEAVNIRLEKWSSIVILIFVKVTIPCVVTPKLATSYFLYFATDAGRDAFVLPHPTMWVDFI